MRFFLHIIQRIFTVQKKDNDINTKILAQYYF